MSSTELQALETQREKILGRHTKELQDLDDQIKNIRSQEMEEIISQARALGFNVTITSNSSKSKKSGSTRKSASCSKCRAVDLTGTGHTARSHDKWLAAQDTDTHGKFE